MTDPLTALTAELAEIGADAVRRGLVVVTGGNLSARLPGSDRFVVTATATRLDRLETGDFSVVDLDGVVVGGNPSPSSEWNLHQRTYRVRADVNAVVHLHPQTAVVLDALGGPGDGPGVGHVHLHRQCRPTECLHLFPCCAQACVAPRQEGDIKAAAGERHRRGTPYPARSPGDDSLLPHLSHQPLSLPLKSAITGSRHPQLFGVSSLEAQAVARGATGGQGTTRWDQGTVEVTALDPLVVPEVLDMAQVGHAAGHVGVEVGGTVP